MAAVPSIGRASLLEPGAAAPEATATHDLYERHGGRIHGYCLRQLGSREEAEDAVQTTFMNAFGALRKGVVPESEAAWLFKIAENVCLSRRRSSWRRGRIESPADFGVIEEVVASPETARDELIGIEDALAAMPTQQRRAILLREWQGLSYREIATELDVTQAAVETLIFRARRSLARGLTEPQTVKPRERRGLRKALHLGDLASVVMGAKALLGGTAAAQAAIAVATVTAVAGVTARPASELVPDTVRAKPSPAVLKPAVVKPAAVTPPPVVPASAPVAEPRRPVVPVSAAGTPAAAKARSVSAEPRTRPASAGGGVVPPSEPSTGAGPQSPAPGRDVAATRPGETGKPAATPGTPPQSAAPDGPEKPAKAQTPAKPDSAAVAPVRPPKPQTPAKLDKPGPTPPLGAGPKSDPPRAEPATLNRPAPSDRPERDALPDRASDPPAERPTLPEQAAEPEPDHRGPPVNPRS